MVKAIFNFSSQSDFDALVKAAKRLGIDVQTEVQEDAPPGLGQAAAAALVGGLEQTKQKQQQQKKKPQTPQEKASAEMADQLDQAIERNPTLKNQMQQTMKRMGIQFEAMDKMIFQGYLKEHDFQTAKTLTKMFSSNGKLFESTVDELTTQMMEFFVALKAQGVKDIPLSKLVTAVGQSDIDIDPNQDMEFFVDLISSLPVVQKVDPGTNKVFLELPGQPEEPESGPEEKEAEKDAIENLAKNKAKSNIKDKAKDHKKASGDLFASKEYNGSPIVESPFFDYDTTGMDTRVSNSIGVAKKIALSLKEKSWNGSDQTVLDQTLNNTLVEGIDHALVRAMSISLFNSSALSPLQEGQQILDLLKELEFPISKVRYNSKKQVWLVEGIINE